MRLSDLISKRILEMIESSEENVAEIQRNEFAERIGCVPSQINYVLSSRFTPEHGYIIDSRRGGGGYINTAEEILAEWSTRKNNLKLQSSSQYIKNYKKEHFNV